MVVLIEIGQGEHHARDRTGDVRAPCTPPAAASINSPATSEPPSTGTASRSAPCLLGSSSEGVRFSHSLQEPDGEEHLTRQSTSADGGGAGSCMSP